MTSTQSEGGSQAERRCGFCRKSQAEVRTLVVSGESAICDECVVLALDTITRRRGQFHLRVAFIVFNAIAAIGHLLRLGR
jgi:ATP-dependent protease Clp ATPase subunit